MATHPTPWVRDAIDAECPEPLALLRLWMADRALIDSSRDGDTADREAWGSMTAPIKKAVETLQKMLDEEENLKDQQATSTLTALRCLRPSLQKKQMTVLLSVVDELHPLLSDLQAARSTLGKNASARRSASISATLDLLSPICRAVHWLHAAFPTKWVRSWASIRVRQLHGDTSAEQPRMLSLVALGSKDHIGTVFDALTGDGDCLRKVLSGTSDHDDKHLNQFIAMRGEVLVDAILKQARPPPASDVDAASSQWVAFVSLLQARGEELRNDTDLWNLVSLLDQLVRYDRLTAPELHSVMAVFADPPVLALEDQRGLPLLKGAHKYSVIMKKCIGCAVKRQQLLASDERSRPQAEAAQKQLDSLNSGEVRVAGSVAREVTRLAGADEARDVGTWQLWLSILMETLTGLAQQSVDLNSPGSQWSTLAVHVRQVVMTNARDMPTDLLLMTQSLIVDKWSQAQDGQAKKAVITPLAMQCTTWGKTIKALAGPARALFDGVASTIAGLATFLHAVIALETIEMPGEETTTLSDELVSTLTREHDCATAGLFHQPGLGVFQALQDEHVSMKEEELEKLAGILTDCRDRAISKHGKLRNILIEHQHSKATAAGCDDSITPDTPVEQVKNALAVVEPIAKALMSLDPMSDASKSVQAHVVRLTDYLPKLQRDLRLSEAIDRHRPGAALPEHFLEMDLDGLQNALTPERIAAAAAAYKATAELARAQEGGAAAGIASNALLLLACKSALMATEKGDEGAEAYTKRQLTPRGMTLQCLPLSIQERLWQVQSELEA